MTTFLKMLSDLLGVCQSSYPSNVLKKYPVNNKLFKSRLIKSLNK